jgi:hypothetical protein
VEAQHICATELLDPDLDEDRCYQPLRLNAKPGESYPVNFSKLLPLNLS